MRSSRISEVLTVLDTCGANYSQILIYLNSIDSCKDQLETCLAFLNRTLHIKTNLNPHWNFFAVQIYERVKKSRGQNEADHLFRELL